MKCEHDLGKSSCPSCSVEQAWKRYDRAATRRGLSFSLSLSEFETLTQAACTFCGQTPSNGVDRKDSRLSYYAENSQPCCKICNRIKSDMDEYFLMRHIEKMCRHAQIRQALKIAA